MSRRDGSIYKDVTVVSAVANRSRIVCKCNEEKRLVRWQRRKAGKVLRFVSVNSRRSYWNMWQSR